MFIHWWERRHLHTTATGWSSAVWRPWTPIISRCSPPGEAWLLLHLLFVSILSRITSERQWLGECHADWRISQPLVFREELFHLRSGAVEPHFPKLISLLWAPGRLRTALTSPHIRSSEGSFSSPLQSFSSSWILVKSPLTKKRWFGLCCFSLSQCWIMMMASFRCH